MTSILPVRFGPHSATDGTGLPSGQKVVDVRQELRPGGSVGAQEVIGAVEEILRAAGVDSSQVEVHLPRRRRLLGCGDPRLNHVTACDHGGQIIR
ncbi:hypothetical protein GIY30_05010 [Gordonia sp. HNM0687]|uniref:Uncharacterized protein n=1 Tax=Gordonia mangrovi TaxID=2665643 RepID=A0A6L7GMY7_9ACTN|nr:hypothetical protein [Gordonia mangrovi]MXP20717.1 hypothetical protein [Gordonia mangrovi]UVF78711.1 hypothetical protein NWF22_02230 [Gordonia mangrovi]